MEANKFMQKDKEFKSKLIVMYIKISFLVLMQYQNRGKIILKLIFLFRNTIKCQTIHLNENEFT